MSGRPRDPALPGLELDLSPIPGAPTEIWRALAELKEPAALATVIGVAGSAPRHTGARLLVFADGRMMGTVGGGQFEYQVIRAGLDVIRSRRAQRLSVHLTRDLGMCCGGAMEVYVEPMLPRNELVIFGAGHVGGEVARLGAALNFRTTVIDSREEWLNEARFPECERRVVEPRAHARTMSIHPQSYVLITTHDHGLDQDLLELLLSKPWAWLGVIGSRSKITKFFLRLRASGVEPTQLDRVSAPVGLDIGAESPAEIAIAVLAELVAVRAGRLGPGAPALGPMSRGGLLPRGA